MLTKKVFHRVGNHIINQYEVRRVELLSGKVCLEGCEAIPKARIWFKDGTKIEVTSKHVPTFIQYLLCS
jgi:hypothetical protein